MSDDCQSIDSGERELSRTTSVAQSLASLKTEEHNELYDHRQQQDFVSHHVDRSSVPPVYLRPDSGAGGRMTGVPGISFQTDSDDNISLGDVMSGKHSQHRSTSFSGSSPKTSKPRAVAASSGSKVGGNNRRGSISLGIPLVKKKSRSSSNVSLKGNPLSRTMSTKSQSSQRSRELRRRVTRGNASIDSDNSQASHLSQETEEDVCFPIQKREHTRMNGIDFDALEEFVTQERAVNMSHLYSSTAAVHDASVDIIGKPQSYTDSTTSSSSAALRYTPKTSPGAGLDAGDRRARASGGAAGIVFGDNRVEPDEYDEDDMKKMNSNYTNVVPPSPEQAALYEVPDRFAYFSSGVSETIHAPDLSTLVQPNQSFKELFNEGHSTWWLDCSCPTDEEMRCLTKAFGIHPLTSEDIKMQETREKVELFKNYYFVCFHTFENDMESEDFLEPINVYIVVFANGILTFHFKPISHCANVRRRVRQLRDYVGVNSDWICYALVDDITDSFAPVIQSIEYEADAIEDSVFMARDMDFAVMLERIGEGRRKTMTLMRLLSGKADVIKMFAKRCQDDINGIGPALTSQVNIANLQFKMPPDSGPSSEKRQQPRADIAMYLGDIQDHIVTMFQNLLSYEKIFSRSHSNYLAQLQVESFNSNNKVTEMLGKVTMIGTMLVPLNVITGLFGMNVRVPGQPDGEGAFYWFFGILGVLIVFAIGSLVFASFWLSRINPPLTLNEAAISGTKSILNFKNRAMKNRSFNLPAKSDKSISSFSTNKMGRYE